MCTRKCYGRFMIPGPGEIISDAACSFVVILQVAVVYIVLKAVRSCSGCYCALWQWYNLSLIGVIMLVKNRLFTFKVWDSFALLW